MRRSLTATFLGALIGIAAIALADNEKSPIAFSKEIKVVPSVTLDDVDVWISDLNASEFSKREEATQRLITAGVIAAKPLLKAGHSCGLEASVRIATILRRWYTSENDELQEAAENALEVLAESKNRPVAHRAAATLEQYAFTIRQDRALAEVKKLGGSIKDLNDGQFNGAITEGDRSFMVILGKNWTGGDDGLKYVRRLSGMTALYLMGNGATGKILTPGVTDEGVAALRRDMPRLQTVAFRGPAFLGISPAARLPGCRVYTVSPESPAAKAMILSGDVITKFEGKPVADFEELVTLIQDKQPGDKVKIHLLRGDEEELMLFDRLQAIKEPNPVKEQLEKLLKRLTVEVDVTLAEWASK